jgi:hypothetical protein
VLWDVWTDHNDAYFPGCRDVDTVLGFLGLICGRAIGIRLGKMDVQGRDGSTIFSSFFFVNKKLLKNARQWGTLLANVSKEGNEVWIAVLTASHFLSFLIRLVGGVTDVEG